MAKQKTDHTPEQSAAPSAHRSWRTRLTGWMRGPQDKPVDVLPVRVGDAQYQACKAMFAGFIEKFGGKDQGAAFLASQSVAA